MELKRLVGMSTDADPVCVYVSREWLEGTEDLRMKPGR